MDLVDQITEILQSIESEEELNQVLLQVRGRLYDVAGPGSSWDEDKQFPVEDWRYEVQNDDTRLGYLEWVSHKREDADEG